MWDFSRPGALRRDGTGPRVGTAPIRPVSGRTAQHLRMNVRMSMRKPMRMHVHRA
jgi:hypothetical protein